MKSWLALAPLLMSVFWITGCELQKIQELQTGLDTGGSSGSTFDCSYYSQYNSYAECESATLANCDSEWQVFPTGGGAQCYFPLDGWETCSSVTTDWIYTPYAVLCDLDGTNYRMGRSVLACSSSVCACMTTPVMLGTCTAITCPAPTPSPMPSCTP